MSYLSNCCGAEPHSFYYFDDKIGICSECHEHTDFEEFEE